MLFLFVGFFPLVAQSFTVTYGGDPMLCQAAVVARNDCMFYATDKGGLSGDNWHCENNNTIDSPDWSRKWYLKLNGQLYLPGSGVQDLFKYTCGNSGCNSGASYTFPFEHGMPLQWCYEGCTIVLDQTYGSPGNGDAVYMVTGDECASCDPGTEECCPPWEFGCSEGTCSFETDPECFCAENPGDWRCEDEDDEPDPGEAVGCDVATPDCGGLDTASCQILVRTHRTHCAVEVLIDVQQGTRGQMLAKLDDLKATNSAAISGQTTTLADKLDQIKTAVQGISPGNINVDTSEVVTAVESGTTATTSAISSQTSTLGGKIDGQTGTLGGKLDDIKTAVQGISPGNVNVSVDNSEVVTAIQNQTSQIVGSSVDPGEGVTQADMDALTVRSVTDGPVGPSVIDMTGYLGSSCPAFDMGFTLGGVPWQLDNTLWCDFLAIINACMHLLAAWWAVMILLGK